MQHRQPQKARKPAQNPASGRSRLRPHIREFREALNLTQEQLGVLVELSQQQVASLENGLTQFNFAKAQRFAAALNCDPLDLMPGPRRRTVPLAWFAALAESEERPDTYEVPAAQARLPAPGGIEDGTDIGSWFAVRVADSHADRLGYPPGSTLFCSPIVPGQKLRRGEHAVARQLADGPTRPTLEVLVGVLDHLVTEEIVLVLASTLKYAPSSVVLQRPQGGAAQFSEGLAALLMPPPSFPWNPRADDPVELLGLVEWAQVPRRRILPLTAR